MTELVRAGTRTAYLGSGIVFVMVFFGWTTAAVWLARFFPAAPEAKAAAPGPAAK